MRFKVDENAPLEFVAMLRQAGHEADHVLEERLGGCSDQALATAIRREERALITLDSDFADIRRFAPREHAGLIVLRPASQHRGHLVALFGRVLTLLDVEPLAHRLWIIDEHGLRVRE